jgi:hypothetical protein
VTTRTEPRDFIQQAWCPVRNQRPMAPLEQLADARQRHVVQRHADVRNERRSVREVGVFTVWRNGLQHSRKFCVGEAWSQSNLSTALLIAHPTDFTIDEWYRHGHQIKAIHREPRACEPVWTVCHG